MNNDHQEMHTLTGTFVRQTERGLLFEVGNVEEWLPKSQIRKLAPEEPCSDGDEITLSVPDWLARDKGFV